MGEGDEGDEGDSILIELDIFWVFHISQTQELLPVYHVTVLVTNHMIIVSTNLDSDIGLGIYAKF
jgi:hypothetical protein